MARPSSSRIAVLFLLVLSGAFLAAVVTLTPWQPLPGATIHAAAPGRFFTAAQQARSERYFDLVKWASWGNLAAGIAVTSVLGFTGLGRALVDRVRARLSHWWGQVTVLVVAVLVAQRLVMLPGAVWQQHVSRDFGLSTQPWPSFALDQLLAMMITLVLSTLGMLLLVAVARRWPDWWFVPAAGAAFLLVIVLSFARPVVVEPLFNHFTPLADGALRQDLLTLAARDGIDVSDVLVADASRRTTALNAYVSGFGSTKRIVIYDTLLKAAPDSEVELVVAHELGHAARDDVLVGTLEGALGASLSVVGLYLVLRPGLLRRRTGAHAAGDPAVAPVIVAVVAVAAFFVLPVQDTISRHIEARADAHALDLTRDPTTFVAMQKRLAVTNLSHLEPNPVLGFWFSDHPPTLDRIGMALAWRRLHRASP